MSYKQAEIIICGVSLNEEQTKTFIHLLYTGDIILQDELHKLKEKGDEKSIKRHQDMIDKLYEMRQLVANHKFRQI